MRLQFISQVDNRKFSLNNPVVPRNMMFNYIVPFYPAILHVEFSEIEWCRQNLDHGSDHESYHQIGSLKKKKKTFLIK